jgi:hypothetical protein
MEAEVTCPYCGTKTRQKFVPRHSGKARLVFCDERHGCGRPFLVVPTFDLRVDVGGVVVNHRLQDAVSI